MTTVLLNETNEDQRNSNAKNNNNEQLYIHSIKRDDNMIIEARDKHILIVIKDGW